MDKKPKRIPKLPYRGQPLFYLLKNIPNHGVGRLIIRSSIRQIEEKPTYMRILQVDITPVQLPRKAIKKKKLKHRNIPIINVTVEKTQTGLTIPTPANLRSVSHLSDFLLVPKEEEEKYLKNSVVIPVPKGHYYLSGENRRAIDYFVSEGMTLLEARRKVLENANNGQAQNGGAEGNGAGGCEFEEDEDDDDTDDDNLASTERTNEKSQQQHRARDMTKEGRPENPAPILVEEDKFGEFTKPGLQRIDNMVNNGVNIDTARQLEWERQIAFTRKNTNTYWTSTLHGKEAKSPKLN